VLKGGADFRFRLFGTEVAEAPGSTGPAGPSMKCAGP